MNEDQFELGLVALVAMMASVFVLALTCSVTANNRFHRHRSLL